MENTFQNAIQPLLPLCSFVSFVVSPLVARLSVTPCLRGESASQAAIFGTSDNNAFHVLQAGFA